MKQTETKQSINELNNEQETMINGGFVAVKVPVPGPLPPVPPIHYTQAIGEDGNPEPEYYW